MLVSGVGGPENLQLMEMPEPAPRAGEALVKSEYAGVNFIDIYMRSGRYAKSNTYKTPLPMIIGMEGGGTVAALGEDVSGLKEGDRVAYCIVRGSYAPFAAVPTWKLVKIPAEVPMAMATALMLQSLTAHYLTPSAFHLPSA